jgi:ATP-dependent 26S proteasome regulatory subunit
MVVKQHVIASSSSSSNAAWEMHIDEVNHNSSGDIYRFSFTSAPTGEHINPIMDRLCKIISDIGATVSVKTSAYQYIIRAKRNTSIVVIRVDGDDGEVNISFDIVGERELAREISDILQANFPKSLTGTLMWFRMEKGSLEYSKIIVKSKRKVYDEFYPWIKEGVESYLDRFMSSESSILLMIGPPGTGKTSLLRHLICSRNLTAMFSYDEDLLESDNFFSKFIVGDADIMVIEDADLLIGSRENGNKLIPRFLNTAEGLVKVDGKKMIFSTNLDTSRSVDEALVRPGRCFDVMKTRMLTHKEMLAVVEAAGLDNTPPWKEEYSLSEIFCPTDKPQKVERRIGF